MLYDKHTLLEILQSLEAEAAKAISENNHAQQDINQSNQRLKFVVASIHYLKQTYGDLKK